MPSFLNNGKREQETKWHFNKYFLGLLADPLAACHRPLGVRGPQVEVENPWIRLDDSDFVT